MPNDEGKYNWQEVVEKGIEALVESLNNIGPTATLDMVVRLSVENRLANELLCFYPQLVTTSEFLSKLTPINFRKRRQRRHKR